MNKPTLTRIALSFVSLTLMLALAPSAFAHRPLWTGEQVTQIPDLDTSFAVYRNLETDSQVDVYTFDAQAGDPLYAGLNIPAIKGLEDYGVTLALVGPGLPAIGHDQLPVPLPETLGSITYESQPGEDFFEPFTQTNYWGRQRVELDLPSSGTYYLLVWNPAGETGKYVMDTGRAEVFGPADLLRFPVWWVRVHAFFGHTPYMLGGAAALVSLGAFFVLRKRHNAGQTTGQSLLQAIPVRVRPGPTR